jgi:hypothetical protein
MHGFVHSDFFGQIGGLQADSDAIFELLPLAVGIEAQDGNLACGAGPQAFQNLYRCGFAGAVRSQQTEDFSRLDFEIDALHCMDVAVGFLEALDGDR